jgi:Rad3-related DNA helicase
MKIKEILYLTLINMNPFSKTKALTTLYQTRSNELNKIEKIKAYAPTLLHTRWTKEELQLHLQDKFGLTSELEDIDESGLVADYAFLMGIYEDYGYIDIYYLLSPLGEDDIYITEISVSDE